MSTKYSTRMGIARRPKPKARSGQRGMLSGPWVIFYLTSALLISFLYYHSPGLWRLLEHARYWLNYVYSFM